MFGNMVDASSDSVAPSTFVDQYSDLFEHGDTAESQLLSDVEYTKSLNIEGQRFQNSYEVIASLKKSGESFNRLNAPRSAAYCSHRMAREYFTAGDYNNAKKFFDGVTTLYRREGWITLLWDTLGYLKECSRKLGLVEDFMQYSLEMAAMPVFSSSGVEAPEGKRAYGPAGPPTLSQRETIQQEVFSLLKGHTSEPSSNFVVEDDHFVNLNVDLVSPLRMAFLTSVAFHSKTMKPGSTAFITVSILSQLPHPVEITRLEIQFNQPSCNFDVVNDEEFLAKEVKGESHDTRLELVPSLILTANKWLRMTFEISSGKSGKLECISINIRLGHQFIFCCHPESPASMEGLILWKLENLMESFPIRNPIITFSGQKYIQVDEPEPQVEVNLTASSPAFVGEIFVISVSVVSKGHAVHSAELKLNLVDAKGGGMLMSPKDAEPFSIDNHHVELLSVSGVFDDDSQSNSDNIKKIQQSFGVVSVPFLGVGQSWHCRLEIKWNRPKSVMLYVSLGYLPNTDSDSQRVNVHRSLQIEGKIPFTISHRFMMPFRREPLLLPKLKSSPNQRIPLPLNVTSILILSAKNCSEIPLRLASASIESDGNQDVECSCSSQHGATNVSFVPTLIVPGEEFKQVFAVTPRVNSPNIDIGTVHLEWARDSGHERHSNTVLMKQKLPSVSVEKPPLVVSLDCPPHAILGLPFSLYIEVCNYTSLLQEIKYALGDSQSFMFTGPHTDSAFILPNSKHIINYKLLPLVSGFQNLPAVTVTSVRYSAAMNPSLAATTVFVYPSKPSFDVGGKSELVQVS